MATTVQIIYSGQAPEHEFLGFHSSVPISIHIKKFHRQETLNVVRRIHPSQKLRFKLEFRNNLFLQESDEKSKWSKLTKEIAVSLPQVFQTGQGAQFQGAHPFFFSFKLFCCLILHVTSFFTKKASEAPYSNGFKMYISKTVPVQIELQTLCSCMTTFLKNKKKSNHT